MDVRERLTRANLQDILRYYTCQFGLSKCLPNLWASQVSFCPLTDTRDGHRFEFCVG